MCCEAGSQPVQDPTAQHESEAMGLALRKVNYHRLEAGGLEFRLPLRSSRLKDYAPKGGGFYHTPPSAV